MLDLITIDLRLNVYGEKDQTHYYWIGLKYNSNNRYWVNSENNVRIPSSKWSWSPPVLSFDDSGPVGVEGCQAVRIFWSKVGNYVNSSVVKVDCDTWANVKSYLCERSDPNHRNRFWSEWSNWSANDCEKTGAVMSHRQRVCSGYACELQGLPSSDETKVCCDIPQTSVSNGSLHRLFDSLQTRAYEGQVMMSKCTSGFSHPLTRYRVTNSTCVNSNTGGGVWSPPIPTYCSTVDCGIPPLGVHARHPVYSGTKYLDVATYYCQPGFKEPTHNDAIITLRCADSDAWVGLDLDPDIKPVCQPVADMLLEWIHYPERDGGTDHCYQLHHRGQTWQQALDTCNGSLLYIDSQSEFNFIKQNILEPQAERSVLWLAGKKEMQERSFRWRLADNVITNIIGYSNWESPGSYGLPYHRDLCIAANYSAGEWKWLNVTCDNKFEFVCKTLQQKRQGGWSEWTKWTDCNRRFIRSRSHICNNPYPFCGGDDCVGDVVDESHCCEEPGEAQYATITFKSIISNVTKFLVPGHYYTYRCNTGYEHFDGREFLNITCLLNGSWSWPGISPPCIPKECTDPGNGSHSYYIKTDSSKKFEHGSIINYGCENGFAAGKTSSALQVGQITCQNGVWDRPPLQCYARVCTRDFARLTAAEYDRRYINKSFIRYIDRKSHESWGWSAADNASSLFGDKYQYLCNRGYQVNDYIDYNITCAYDGIWRRSETDINLHPDTCEPVSCQGSPPQPLTNSFWVSGVDPDNKNIIGKYLDQANYECIRGYQVNTNIKGDERVLLTYSFTCGANNDWKDQFSPDHCRRQSCGDPGAGSNIENRIGRTFLYKDTVDYVCKQGYIYNGVVTRRRVLCDLYDGSNATVGAAARAYVRWNDSALDCDKVTCGDPGTGTNVSREGKNFDYGSIVTYTCVPQHVLIGGGLERLWIRCTAQGTWNGTVPSCEPAEIASDFSVIVFRPYTVRAQWIMSEKYDTIHTEFTIEFKGLPGYMSENTSVYISDIPPEAEHEGTINKTNSKSGLISLYLLTRPEYVYLFKLHSSTKVSTELWPASKSPIKLYTDGGLPFLGSVQERNLPFIIPLHLLPSARKRPFAVSAGIDSLEVTFDVSMFSEQNATILGFTVIVKEVHPWHNTEDKLAEEGYHDRYVESLYTWNRLDYFTDYKYITWPAYYALPFCNIFDPNAECEHKVGPIPSHADIYRQLDPSRYLQSIYSNFSDTSGITKVSIVIGSTIGCQLYEENTTCNGPLRRNRRFCVKLRAYTKYGWNDSMCSNVIEVEKQLEFDFSLLAPTILAATPFTIFIAIIIGMRCRYYTRRRSGQLDEEDEDESAADREGDLIRTWTMGEKTTEGDDKTRRRKQEKKGKNAKRKMDSDIALYE